LLDQRHAGLRTGGQIAFKRVFAPSFIGVDDEFGLGRGAPHGGNARGIVTAADLVRYRHGDLVRTAGAVIVRQRPGTAKGLLFLTLEDETGMSQAIISPDLLQRHRQLIVGSPGLVVEGVLQKRDGSISVRGERFWAIEEMLAVPSHDFR